MNFLDPIVTAHPMTGALRNVTPELLHEVYLVPLHLEADPSDLLADVRAPWAESYAIAPREAAQSVMAGLRALILATPRLERGEVDLDALPEGTRLHRHCRALMALWHGLGDGLPADLQVMRHVIAADGVEALEALPLIDTRELRFATRAEESLRAVLLAHHGPAPEAAHVAWADRSAPLTRGAPEGSSLHAAQHGLLGRALAPQPPDGTLTFWGARDLAEEAELAAAIAQRRLDAGAEPSDIALLLPDDATYHPHLRDAFDAAGILLSGLPEPAPRRDLARETLLHFLLALRTPAPAMALASLYVSPLMPWPVETGAVLAREVMQGRFDPRAAQALEGRAARLFRSVRADPPRDAAGVAARLDVLGQSLTDASDCREDATLLRSQIGPLKAQLAAGAQPDWDALFSMLNPQRVPLPATERFVEGVSVFTESALPWRPAQNLIVLGMAAGHYPRASGVSPLFLDSELATLRAATGLNLPDRGAQLTQRLELFRRQLCGATQSATFLCPMRGLDGARQGPSTALSLLARGIADPASGKPVDEPETLIADIRATDPADWPCAARAVPLLIHDPAEQVPADGVIRLGRDLFVTRCDSEGVPRRQSPSRLETLLVSPLAWALAEFGAEQVIWAPEGYDHILAGTLAHEVFELLFPKERALPDEAEIIARVPELLAQAVRRNAPFMQAALWRVERQGLTRDVIRAATRWSEALAAAGAEVIDNEIALMGEAHGLRMYGRADCLLRLPGGRLLIVDHKKAGSGKRRERMEAGWDLQLGLYRAMLLRPDLKEGALAEALRAGPEIGVAYHLMNDGGILLNGIAPPTPAFETVPGDISQAALDLLRLRIKEVGEGSVRLNTLADEADFEKTAKLTPYALKDNALVAAFLVDAPLPAEDEDA